jgi:serine/threonine-protein kinase RsbW
VYKAMTEEFVIRLLNPDDLQLTREVITDAAGRAGFASYDAGQIVSAVFEACANAVTHGRACGADHAVLTVRILPDRIEAVILDNGRGFITPSNPSMPPITSSRGRGIPLMFTFMDEVTIDCHHGCKVTLSRRRPKPTP